jgi:16S rRNA (uracil1498-N3)-methyltransferase
MTPRFFVDDRIEDLARRPDADTGIDLPPEVSHHAARVLRLRVGEPLVLFDGLGGEYLARVIASGPPVRVRIDRFDPIERESPLDVTLVQAMIAADKLDWVVEKATELGVARIVVVDAARSVVRLAGERLRRRETRWNEIAVAACCQCGRNRVPKVAAASDLDAALARAPIDAARLILAPDAGAPLSSGPPLPPRLALLIGPEGGWCDDEVARAVSAGCRLASLGPRVLRTETAGLAALAAVQALGGDLR